MHAHHAYYIEGPLSQFGAYQEVLKPFWSSTFERFGIRDARELITLTSLKQGGESVFLIGASSMTTEAQQALLKLFEEPGLNVVFVLLIPLGTLIPTLRSRMLPYPSLLTSRSDIDVKKFLKSTVKERTDFIAKMLKDEEGVKEKAREFIDALEIELSHNMQDAKAREGLSDIAKVRSYLSDRSPSLKMLLEHLALCLPQS